MPKRKPRKSGRSTLAQRASAGVVLGLFDVSSTQRKDDLQPPSSDEEVDSDESQVKFDGSVYKDGDEDDDDAAWKSLPKGAEPIIRQIAAEAILEEVLDKVNDRETVLHDVVYDVVKEFPGTCYRTYKVLWEDGSVRDMLPFWIICCLNPPLRTLEAVYDANPSAVFQKEPCKSSLSLHLASAFEASLEVVQFIHSKNPDAVRTPRNDGVLPLHLAAGFYSGDPSIVNFLLDCYPEGAKKVCSGIQWSPMHSASHGGIQHVEVLERLHSIDSSMITRADKHGRIPLHLASLSKQGNSQLIQFLMQCEPTTASVEDNLFGRTPVHLVCINQSPECIGIMLDSMPEGAHTINTYGGANILAWAAMRNSPEAVDYLARRFPQMLAAQTMDEARYTPLYCAIYNGACLETMKILIEHYPQALFMKDGSGRRPLRAARSSGANRKVIQLLEASEREYRHLAGGGWFYCF